ncbi:putative nitroreductase family protein [Nocardia nova SH22a]|uniref:Putative nitroreductase family protein n=1 Tax=Nocardia nova SH22a TaxID=1415166 RepID=W5TKA7_9NOCA|nr:NAD(P)H nitroreductase [Nocardia nova]AHH19672.1 putative nitroreductase family protein [Nocardia nova SH22a]
MSTVPTRDVVEKAVELAGHAPSLHNSQPWRWTFDGAKLRLFSVHERMLPATDSTGRQLVISCGIVLDHLRAAMAAQGWQTLVAAFPNPNDHTHLADLRFTPSRYVTDGDRERAAAITRRYTDRLPFDEPDDWDQFETVLRTVVEPADTIVDVLPDGSRAELARASELSASLRRYDSAYHAELHWWTGHVVADAGVPRQALVTEDERERVDVGRRMPTVTGEARRPDVRADRSKILVLSTFGDTAEDWLLCGQIVSTVLLESTLAGYATCPLTHLTELPRSRAVIARLIGRNAFPQVLIRVGSVPESQPRPEPTPRLPLGDILRVTGDPA